MSSPNLSLRTVAVTRYVTPLREGGSLPGLVEADDGFLYVVKFRGAGQGVKALIAELIVGELARALGLRLPELVFIELDEAFGRSEPDEEIQDLLRASTGQNLALHYLSGAITFDPLTQEDSLEFIPGSHLGTVYNTSKFDPKDDTRPNDESLPLPRLPPIEAQRDKYEIISWPVERGDVVFFHFRTMHGGAPTRPGQRRRTLTLRFFGERAHYDPKGAKSLPNFPDMAEKLRPGDVMRAPGFLQLHPVTAAAA